MRLPRLKTTRAVLAIGCLLGALIVLTSNTAFAQRHTISGTITDVETGEVLIGANVVAVTLDTGTASNTYGFYSLTLPQRDSLTLVYSFLGFEPQIKKIYLSTNIALDIALSPRSANLDEVTVTADRLSAMSRAKF